MPSPAETAYATIIIPTLNRSSTLPIALKSAQQQTIDNIEILLVLDGATQACRDIAWSAARTDPRVTVLDLPKAPGNGKINVDLAITKARAPRIFYNDDDDVLLSRHVEELGPLLDKADIADSRVASAGREFDLHLGPCTTSAEHPRRLLSSFKHKTIFDTHFAHTKRAYERFGNWRPKHSASPKPVWKFMAGLAGNPDCVWTHTPSVTAVSLHGANRIDMTPNARRNEIEVWGNTVLNPQKFSELLGKSSSVVHLSRLLAQDDADCTDFDAYLDLIGAYDDVSSDVLARTLFDLVKKLPGSVEDCVDLIEVLSRPDFVGYPVKHTASLLQRAFGLNESISLLHSLVDQCDPQHAGILALTSVLHDRKGDTESALRFAEHALEKGPDVRGQLTELRDSLL